MIESPGELKLEEIANLVENYSYKKTAISALGTYEYHWSSTHRYLGQIVRRCKVASI